MGKTFTERFGLAHPIVLAPMAGAASPQLVAAVCNAGGLGSWGAAYQTPEQIAERAVAIRRLTDRPFAINLFAGGYHEGVAPDAAQMLAVLEPHFKALGLPAPEAPVSRTNPFAMQLAAVIAAKPAIFSFAFGIPDAAALRQLKEAGIYTIGTATTLAEADALAAAGVDAIAAQGAEAGGHRSTFLHPFEDAMVGMIALVRSIAARHPDIPVIAGGGIMDGRGIVAALALGAAAASLGTAFLTTHECPIGDAYKERILNGRAEDTMLIRGWSGRPARGLPNGFAREAAAHPKAILPFPLQNDLTRPLRNAAAVRNDAEHLSLWAGQGLGLARRTGAAELMRLLAAEMVEARDRVSRASD